MGLLRAMCLAGLACVVVAESVKGREKLAEPLSIIKELKETHRYYLASASITELPDGRLLAVSKIASARISCAILICLGMEGCSVIWYGSKASNPETR